MKKLRCWPGCIARVTRVIAPVMSDNVGKLVEVIKLNHGEDWDLRPIQPMLGGFLGVVRTVTSADICHGNDAYLMPITPPPGTVTDEEVRELYAPNKEKSRG